MKKGFRRSIKALIALLILICAFSPVIYAEVEYPSPTTVFFVNDFANVLSQDVEAAKRIYDSVLQRSNQLNLEKQTEQANVSILSPAVEPTAPAKPDVPKYLAVTLLGAFAAALAAAIRVGATSVAAID